MGRIYPAIFHREEDGAYSVEFPDLAGCVTVGNTLEEAFIMAKQALALYLDGLDEENLIKPTAFEDVDFEGEDRVMLVEADNGDDIVYFKRSAVAKAIEAGLENKHFTKYQVAQILDVDKGYISRISSGQRVPAPEMAKRIGLLLGFDWRVFFDDVISM